jgi:hypothetical protein
MFSILMKKTMTTFSDAVQDGFNIRNRIMRLNYSGN